MSHSPSGSRIHSSQQGYVEAWSRVNELLRSGRSFSGREKNCAYLNLGGKRFANVSAISNFDAPLDGRALAVSDWDQDGDLDVWMTNRNGPRARFLVNSYADSRTSDANFLALRLQSTSPSSNRDAIGARVRVKLLGQDGALLRTVRAGEGYLSQSSRWLHFGLGAATQIESIEITWPDGQAEVVPPPPINAHYHVTQGSGSRRLDVVPRSIAGAVSRTPVSSTNSSSSLATHNLLTRRMLLPPASVRAV